MDWLSIFTHVKQNNKVAIGFNILFLADGYISLHFWETNIEEQYLQETWVLMKRTTINHVNITRDLWLNNCFLNLLTLNIYAIR